VPHAGTFNANPVTMAAGLAAMRLMDEVPYVRLNELGEQLRKGVTARFERTGFPGMVAGRGSLFRIHPFRRDLVDYRSSVADATEAARLDALYRGLLDHGVLIAPAGLGCLSTIMTEAELDYFLEALTLALHDTGYRARA
jgi:glutamate-1-semialdehyde 2,1-aminomutase